MGIRFACHHCGKPLNIKHELAGKRGVCPTCSGKFRIPLADAESSLPVEVKPEPGSTEHGSTEHGSTEHGSTEHGSTETTASVNRAESSSAEPSSTKSVNPSEHIGATTVGTDPSNSEKIPSGIETAQVPVEKSATVVGNQVLAPAPKKVAEVLGAFDSTASWYVRPPSGGQYGPANTVIFGQWIEEGRVASNSLVWRDGWQQWRSATEAFPELAGQLPGGSQDQQASDTARERLDQQRMATETLADRSGQTSSLVKGENHFGEQTRNRSTRRAVMLLGLVVITVALVGALIYVIWSMQAG